MCFLVEFAKQQVQPTLYSYNVLSRATGDFHQDNKLGEGGFGVVYKVILLTYFHFTIIHLFIFLNSNLNFDFDLLYENFPFFVYLVGDFIGWDKIGNKIIDNKISPRH